MADTTYTGIGAQSGITSDGTMSVTTANGHVSALVGRDCSIRFRATCTGLAVNRFLGGDKMLIAIDGVDQTVQTIPNTGANGTFTFTDTLDGLVEHEYTVYCVGQDAAGASYLYDLTTLSGTINTSALVDKPIWAFYGDSITRGVAGSGTNSALAFPHLIAEHFGVGCLNLGISGTTVVNTGANSGSVRYAAVPSNAQYVVILYGVNDTSDGDTFEAAYRTMLAGIRGIVSAACRIVCLGIFNCTPTIPKANRLIYNPRILRAASDYDAHYIETEGWITP